MINFGRTGLGYVAIGLPVALFVALAFTAPGFLDAQNLSNITSQVTALLLVSLGQLMVALVTGIDLSVGSVLSVTSGLIASQDASIAIPAAIGIAIIVGLVNGVGSAVFGVHPIVMTLSTATILQGLAIIILPVPGGTVAPYILSLASGRILGLPVSLVWCVAGIALVSVCLYRTRFGLRLFAIGANPVSAHLNGVSYVLPVVTCYVACSLFAVAAGIFLTARVSSGDPNIGTPFALLSVTAIALGGVQLAGGTGSVIGVLAGVLTLGLMTNGMNLLGVSPFLTTALTGFLLLGAISTQRRAAVGL